MPVCDNDAFGIPEECGAESTFAKILAFEKACRGGAWRM